MKSINLVSRPTLLSDQRNDNGRNSGPYPRSENCHVWYFHTSDISVCPHIADHRLVCVFVSRFLLQTIYKTVRGLRHLEGGPPRAELLSFEGGGGRDGRFGRWSKKTSPTDRQDRLCFFPVEKR